MTVLVGSDMPSLSDTHTHTPKRERERERERLETHSSDREDMLFFFVFFADTSIIPKKITVGKQCHPSVVA